MLPGIIHEIISDGSRLNGKIKFQNRKEEIRLIKLRKRN
jgi:hypothetical protein